MLWCIKKCNFCGSANVAKKGKQSGRQRFVCRSCGHQFQSKRRKSRLQKKLWKEYVSGKQTAAELGTRYGKCRQWISSQLSKVNGDDLLVADISPQSIVVVADATFFSRSYGVLVFREPNLKRNLIWKEIHSESPGQYEQLKLKLEEQGFHIKAAVLDGKRGIRAIFGNIPIQMCQFHQVAIINRYLTRRPILEAGKELRRIALKLTQSTEEEFSKQLNDWHAKWQGFLKEKTINPLSGSWCYTHKRIRSAYRSLQTNLPYLFIYLKYPELNIPNTCNSIDGSNTTLKNLLRVHRGISRENRYKMICQILKNSYPKKLT